MSKKGKNKYVPSIVLIELRDIQREDGIMMEAEAFRKMVKYTRVGRELNRLKNIHYDWSKKIKLPTIEPKNKGKRSIFDLFV